MDAFERLDSIEAELARDMASATGLFGFVPGATVADVCLQLATQGIKACPQNVGTALSHLGCHRYRQNSSERYRCWDADQAKKMGALALEKELRPWRAITRGVVGILHPDLLEYIDSCKPKTDPRIARLYKTSRK